VRTATLTSAAPAAQVVELVLPSNIGFKVQSVVATIDATGAGDTIAELRIADPSGEVIAAQPQGEPILAGTSGLATWALRLAAKAKRSTGGGGITLEHNGVPV
jgi:hypothetical protein